MRVDNKIFPAVLDPRESAQWIVENTNPHMISIDSMAVQRVAKMICHSTLEQIKLLEFSECEVQPKTGDRAAIDWIFFVDSINFSFWSESNDRRWEGKTYSGYFAACAAVNRALERGIPLTSANHMAKIDCQQLAEIFHGDNGSTIPMLDERVEVIRQNGKILLEKFEGSFYNCLPKYARNAQNLLRLIVENFPNFRDFAEYKGKKVSFLKRAQILVADVHNCLKKNKDPIEDINELTMFADYRVPQALAYLGVFRYSSELLQTLRSGEILESGSQLEVQLRAFSIEACDSILREIRTICYSPPSMDFANLKFLEEFAAVDVDVWLWLWRREHAEEIEAKIPFHRCRSIYY